MTPPNFNHKCALYKIGILLLLLSLSGISLAQRVEIISVQHRSAEEIAEQIKVLYPEQHIRIAGSHQQITVRADNTVINEVRQLVQTFDIPLRQFLISTSSDQNINTRNQNQSTSVHHSGSRKKTYQTRDADNQSITVLEGHSARLNSGQKKPVETHQFINGQWTNSIEYIDMTRGIYVKPRLIGSDQVEIKIISQKNEASTLNQHQRNSSTIDTSMVSTVRVIQLGEWVNIGGVYYNTQKTQGGINYSSKQSDIDKQSIMIKVELLPD